MQSSCIYEDVWSDRALGACEHTLMHMGTKWHIHRSMHAAPHTCEVQAEATPTPHAHTHTDEAHLLASTLSRPSSAESSEDGFKLFCSQTYQRQSSPVTDPGSNAPEDSEEDEEQHLSWSARGRRV